MRLYAAAVCLLSLVACTSHDRYLISRGELDDWAKKSAAGQPPAVLPAVRESDHKAVFVKTSALTLPPAPPAPLPDSAPAAVPASPAAVVPVQARAKNPMVTAGAVLTWVGTALSLIGTGVFIAGKVQGNNSLYYGGGIAAISAEPLMWTGTILWLLGAVRKPYEVRVSGPARPVNEPRSSPP
jgi:hypothetical protein